MAAVMTRREVLGTFSATAVGSAAVPPPADAEIVRAHDEAVGRYLAAQNTDSSSRWYGGTPDATGLYNVSSAATFANVFAAAFLHPQAKGHRDPKLIERIRLAAGFLERFQTPDGNIDLLITNFNSPPDTGFVVWNAAEAASIARKYGAPEIEKALTPFLKKAAGGMVRGGVHTPNHRWVVCSALAQIHALWPDAAFTRRIDQWLAEGVDIDEDGQFTERSTTVYNAVTDRAFTIMALKLGRKNLLEPVRRNLESMWYLLHADGEVVTEISRRQDAYVRGGMDRYWLAVRALATLDRNGQCAALLRRLEPRSASLASLMDYPEIAGAPVSAEPLPENYERLMKSLGVARIRRGSLSATVVLEGASRFFSVRRGDAVVEAVRFASAFFGKGQFVPTEWSRENKAYVLRQRLEAGYYQPLEPTAKVAAGEWSATRTRRKVTEVSHLLQSAIITETEKGFRLRLQSKGTEGVPLAVEIGLRDGVQIEGAELLSPGEYLLSKGPAVCKAGANTMRFSPGIAEHKYVRIRGVEAPLAAPRLYLTGFTPFDHTIEIELS